MLPAIALTLSGLALAYATFWQGAFDSYRFSVTAALLALAALLPNKKSEPGPIPLWALAALLLLPLYLLLQLLPIPLGALATLSPRAVELAHWLGRTSASISIAPNASLAYTFRILTALAVFFLIRQLAAQLRWLALLPIVAIATLEAILGLTQAAGSVTVVGTYVNRDHYSFLLEISLPFAIMGGIAAIRQSRETRNALVASLLFAAAALLLLGVIFSLSRAGFVTTLGFLFLLTLLNLQRRFRTTGIFLLPLAFVTLFFILPITPLVLRFSQIATDELDNDGARHLIWKDSVPVLRDFPVFGAGLGGFENAVRRHQTTGLMYTIGYAHNEYIQFLIELGLIGVLLALIPLAWLLYILYTALDDPLAKATLAAFAAIFLHCIVDFNLQVPANLLTVAWIAGVAASLAPSKVDFIPAPAPSQSARVSPCIVD